MTSLLERFIQKTGTPRGARKFVFVVGGVMSGVGKGIATSSIGTILKARGFRVTAIKIDPYINVDAGTMNPTEHGEVFVLDDGDETDQDMGNYERFLDTTLTRINYMTTGRVYQEVIRRERNLEYGGKNVEVVPDIPLEVLRRIKQASENANADVTLIEIGGTIGEYQNILFLEAARMLKQELPEDVAFVMVSYLPMPPKIGEIKTKPTQYAARTLNSAGIQADIILARSEVPIDEKRRAKLALFCNVRPEHVISAPDVDSIYDIPLNFEKDGLGEALTTILGLPSGRADFGPWETLVDRSKSARTPLKIAVVGKYFDSGDFVLSDVYISVIEAVKFSAYREGMKPELTWFNSKDFEKGTKNVSELGNYDGIVVPGGFGSTGVEGIIKAITYARENKVPYFGLCYGMQLATIEYARNVVGLSGAHTTEINADTLHPIIVIMDEQREKMARKDYGGTMRLGAWPALLKPGSVAYEAYTDSKSYTLEAKSYKLIHERHRHRYEVNPAYIERLEAAGYVFSGQSPDRKLMEIAELPKETHPFFLGTQFHPELKARPLAPHPLFTAFVKAACLRRQAKERSKKR